MPSCADTEQRLLEFVGFCCKYFSGIQWQSATLVSLVSNPWFLVYFISFQLKRNTAATTMMHSCQACCKAIVWALHRVCTPPALACNTCCSHAKSHQMLTVHCCPVQAPMAPEEASNLRAIMAWYHSLMEDAKCARPKRRRTDPVVLAASKQWIDGETMLQLSYNFLMEGEPRPSSTAV